MFSLLHLHRAGKGRPTGFALSRSRPTTGIGHYLRDLVYGSVDGVITTLAVVAGATGASLEARVALILGFANLAADGLSMGASNYLALRSELEQTGASVRAEKPWRHGLTTSAAFVTVGGVPLLAFLRPLSAVSILQGALLLSVVALAIAGAIRARYIGRTVSRSAFEMVAVGLSATGAAYAIGRLAEFLTR